MKGRNNTKKYKGGRKKKNIWKIEKTKKNNNLKKRKGKGQQRRGRKIKW